MRVLMLGNSLTIAHGLPEHLAELLSAEVVVHARGGARLAEQLNPKTKLGTRTTEALAEEHWDYVILQEMSNGPVTHRARFLESAAGLCQLVREHGATPVLYATWPYAEGSAKLEAPGLSFAQMREGLYAAYHEAAEANHALVADVGEAFCTSDETHALWARDGVHPTHAGTRLAAQVLAQTIQADWKRHVPILVTCGTGTICSTIVMARLKEHCRDLGLIDRVSFSCCAACDIAEHVEGKAFVVAVVELPPDLGVPVVSGNTLLYRADADALERFDAQLAVSLRGSIR